MTPLNGGLETPGEIPVVFSTETPAKCGRDDGGETLERPLTPPSGGPLAAPGRGPRPVLSCPMETGENK